MAAETSSLEGRCGRRRDRAALVVSCGLPLFFIAASGLYGWNNRLPVLHIPEPKPPVPNAYPLFAEAVQAYVPPPPNSAIDALIDTSRGDDLPLFSPPYNRLYPLARKLAYLKANQLALVHLRQGLKWRYLQPPERHGKDVVQFEPYSGLKRLLLVEAHARAQAGDWDGAADSLLDVLHMGYTVPAGGSFRAALLGAAIRKGATREFGAYLAYLSSSKSRSAIALLEAWQQTEITGAEALEGEKWAMQSTWLEIIKQHELRSLYVSYGCFGCKIPPAQYQRDLDSLSPLLTMRLAWMNKPAIISEYTRCMDSQIAEARKPYPQRNKISPFPVSDDPVWLNVYPAFPRALLNFEIRDARDALLRAMLALHAYRLDTGSYPPSLVSLVPHYLKRLPLDPFSNGMPLIYKPVPVSYLIGYQKSSRIGRAVAATPGVPSTAISLGTPLWSPEGPGSRRQRFWPVYTQLPFRLYSRGPNCRDDGGVPYENADQVVFNHYRVELLTHGDEPADIVAGINSER